MRSSTARPVAGVDHHRQAEDERLAGVLRHADAALADAAQRAVLEHLLRRRRSRPVAAAAAHQADRQDGCDGDGPQSVTS
jgi:hypothetical protein